MAVVFLAGEVSAVVQTTRGPRVNVRTTQRRGVVLRQGGHGNHYAAVPTRMSARCSNSLLRKPHCICCCCCCCIAALYRVAALLVNGAEALLTIDEALALGRGNRMIDMRTLVVLFTCGSPYMLVALFILSPVLLDPPQRQEWAVSELAQSLQSSVFFALCGAGGVVMSSLADRFGRKRLLQLTSTGAILLGLGCAAATSSTMCSLFLFFCVSFSVVGLSPAHQDPVPTGVTPHGVTLPRLQVHCVEGRPWIQRRWRGQCQG